MGMTQPELARLCGWDGPQSRISNYENDSRQPKVDDLFKLSKHLNTSVAFLVGETINPLPPVQNDESESALAQARFANTLFGMLSKADPTSLANLLIAINSNTEGPTDDNNNPLNTQRTGPNTAKQARQNIADAKKPTSEDLKRTARK